MKPGKLLLAFIVVVALHSQAQSNATYPYALRKAIDFLQKDSPDSAEYLLFPLLFYPGRFQSLEHKEQAIVLYLQALKKSPIADQLPARIEKIKELIKPYHLPDVQALLPYYETTRLIKTQQFTKALNLLEQIIHKQHFETAALDSFILMAHCQQARCHQLAGNTIQANLAHERCHAAFGDIPESQTPYFFSEWTADYLNFLFQIQKQYHKAGAFLNQAFQHPYHKKINALNIPFFVAAIDYALVVGNNSFYERVYPKVKAFLDTDPQRWRNEIGIIHLRQAQYYGATGQASKMLYFALEAEQILSQNKENSLLYEETQEILANHYFKSANYERGTQHMNILLNHAKKRSLPDLANGYIAAAQLFKNANQHYLASAYRDSAETTFHKIAKPSLQAKEAFYLNMIKLGFSIGHLKDVKSHLQLLTSEYKRDVQTHTFKYLKIDAAMAYIDILEHRHQKALQNLYILKNRLHPITKMESNQSLVSEAEEIYKKIESMILLAWLREYKETGKMQSLKNAWANFVVLMEQLDFQKEVLLFDTDMIAHNSYFEELNKRGYEIAWELNQISPDHAHHNHLIRISQRLKGNALFHAIHNKSIKAAMGIRQELLTQDEEITRNYHYFTAQLNTEHNVKKNDSLNRYMISQYKIAIDRKEKLNQQMMKENSRYRQAFNQPTTRSLDQIQKSLRPNQVALDYLFIGNTCFIQKISYTQIETFKIDWNSQDESALQQVLNEVQQPFWGTESDRISTFWHNSYLLYQKLLHPLHLKPNTDLWIIPHQQLAKLPFEVLITSNEEHKNFSRLPYAIHQHAFTYSQTLSLLSPESARPVKVSGITAFNPDYEWLANEDSMLLKEFPPLQGSYKEIDHIKALWRTKVFEKEKATIQQFLKQSGQNQIIHLAMHTKETKEDSDNNNLVFSSLQKKPEMLTMQNIYSMHFHSPLIILAACNTATGRYISSEGVWNFNRAFMVSGTKSIISAMWPVNDESGYSLICDFYTALHTEKTKDHSLQYAKIQHLKKADAISGHPYFWAYYILSGDPAAINEKKQIPVLLYLVPFILSLTYFASNWLRRRKARSW